MAEEMIGALDEEERAAIDVAAQPPSGVSGIAS